MCLDLSSVPLFTWTSQTDVLEQEKENGTIEKF